MPIARQRANIVVGNVTDNIAFHAATNARNVVNQRARETAFVRMGVGTSIGWNGMASAAKNGGLVTGNKNSRSLKSLAVNVSSVAMTIRAFWTSIISTQKRRISRRTEAIRRQYDWVYGPRKWITSNSFAPTVTASKHTPRRGGPKTFFPDIACKRIEEAYRQPDLFIEPPKKMEQPSLLDMDAEP